jgi:SAM-dependent methyltransferase
LAMPRPFSLLDYYLTSVEVGFKSLPGGYRKEAAARILNPLSYPRYMEFQLALKPLLPVNGRRVLDIGSPKLPVLLLAKHARSCELYATDIRDYFIAPTAHFLTKIGKGDRLGKDIHLCVQDARHLTYDDEFFDRIFSISVLEHIPDSGDSQAVQEIARVLRPGGAVTVTVPYDHAGYREEFVSGPVYERREAGRTFYQRHYDRQALQQRLLDPSGLRVLDVTFFGEPGFQVEPWWNQIPMRWKVPLLWAQPFAARVFLKQLAPAQLHAAAGVAVRLRKDS